jgi:DNA-binding CsgD family transcriptional regulator
MARLNIAPSSADREALAVLARTTEVPEVVSLNCQVSAFRLCDLGDWRACADRLQVGYEASARLGAIGPEQMLGGYLALFQVALGRVADAREVLRLVLASRPTGMYGALAHAQSLLIALRAGDDARAELHLRWLRELVNSFEDMVGLWGPTVVAEYHLHHDRPRAALELLSSRIEQHSVLEPMYGDLMLMWCARASARWCQQARDTRDAAGIERSVTMLDEALAARNRAPVPAFAQTDNPVSAAARAAFEADRARCTGSDDAVLLLRAAGDSAQRAGLRHDAVVAMVHEAELLVGQHGRRGGRPEAARRLRQAHALAIDIEAHRLRDRIEATARAARLSLDAPPNGTTKQRTTFGITPRESEVLVQLAAGATYAEIAAALFISQKTVSAHVSNLLSKTGTHGRADVVAWARRQGVLES